MRNLGGVTWMTPEELIEEGLQRSRVVMVNEAHDGMLRCRRTREVGSRLLPIAHRQGVRALAMEAFGSPGMNFPRDGGYLAQPDMAAFITGAESLGWAIFGYEADNRAAPREIRRQTMSRAYTTWREREQAKNLLTILDRLDTDAHLLVWGGWGHILKVDGMMAGHFKALSGTEPFVIDQTVTVLTRYDNARQLALIEWARSSLEKCGGTAGFLVNESTANEFPPGSDAVLLSIDNSME